MSGQVVWTNHAKKGSLGGLLLAQSHLAEAAALRNTNRWTLSSRHMGTGRPALYRCGMGIGEGLGYLRKPWLKASPTERAGKETVKQCQRPTGGSWRSYSLR